MDVWVNFKNATKWQAEGIFKCFFPADHEPSTSSQSPHDPLSQDNPPGSRRKKRSIIVPPLLEPELNLLAKRFADVIPEDEFSVRYEYCPMLIYLTSL